MSFRFFSVRALSGSMLAFVFGCYLHGQAGTPTKPGPLPGGGYLLPNSWVIRAAGEQVPVGTLPLASAVSANGKFLLVLNAGYQTPSMDVIDVAAKKVVSSTSVPDAWLGLHLLPRGNKVYVGGGSRGVVYEFAFNDATGVLASARTFNAAATDSSGTGIEMFIGDVTVSPDEQRLYAADVYGNRVVVFDLQSGSITAAWKCGHRPYRLLLLPGGNQLVVSSWADASIYQYNARSGDLIARNRVAPHPTDMVYLAKPVASGEGSDSPAFSGRLFVAASNTNSVYTFGVTKEGTFQQLESIDLSLSSTQPLGMTPSALALNNDGTRLFVACSDGNAVGVADLSERRVRIAGFIPSGRYPTAINLLPDNALAITNGQGLPGPGVGLHSYIPGSVSFVPDLSSDQLSAHTQTVLQTSHYHESEVDTASPDPKAAFFAKTERHPSPVQHIIYIVKGSRSYEEIFGNKGVGGLGATMTPNEHALASQFIQFGNFYGDGASGIDGLNWASAAIAPDFVTKLAPNWQAGRSKSNLFEGGELANSPPAGYLWSNAVQAGLSVRSYGLWTVNTATRAGPGQPQIVKINDPSLLGKVDLNFRGYDPAYPDIQRAQEFVREWQSFDTANQLPDLSVVRLANDEAQEKASGAHTIAASVADNDAGLGLIVDAVTHSKAWSSTAIFVIQQSGSNSNHLPAFIISPWTNRNTTNTQMYDGASMLRTIELLLGLRPMTQFDAAAKPMFSAFSQQADTKPFTALPPQSSLSDRNLRGAPTPSE